MPAEQASPQPMEAEYQISAACLLRFVAASSRKSKRDRSLSPKPKSARPSGARPQYRPSMLLPIAHAAQIFSSALRNNAISPRGDVRGHSAVVCVVPVSCGPASPLVQWLQKGRLLRFLVPAATLVETQVGLHLGPAAEAVVTDCQDARPGQNVAAKSDAVLRSRKACSGKTRVQSCSNAAV